MKLIALTKQGTANVEISESELGHGGEGSVFRVVKSEAADLPEASKMVAKIYHDPKTENRNEKLRAMLKNPVLSEGVAWPKALLFGEDQRFLGYLMDNIDNASNREWLYLANAKDRRRVAPDFNVRYAFAAIRNLAVAIEAIHSAGHCIGDINESNLLINASATVSVVDTDSMQISDALGSVFPCTVGKPEYTAPELSHGSLRDNPRTIETDIFAFAVAAYQLISGGATPHQGAFDPNRDDEPISTVERIRKGVLPSLDPVFAKQFGFTPRPGVPIAALPEFMKKFFLQFLSTDPKQRNSSTCNLKLFIAELDSFIPQLTQCSVEKNHWKVSGESCGWCVEAKRSGVDPWASEASVSQAKLRPITFSDGATSSQSSPQRAPAAIAGTSIPPSSAVGQTFSPSPQLGYPSQPQPQATPQSSRPKKIRGKITVTYADGTWGIRPPMSALLIHNPKFAFFALKEETPGLLRFWWPKKRLLAPKVGILLGFATGVLISVLWFFVTFTTAPLIPIFFATAGNSVLLSIAAAPAILSFLTTFLLFVSASRDRSSALKKVRPGMVYKEETVFKTLFNFVLVSLFYGVPALFALLFILVATLLKNIFRPR